MEAKTITFGILGVILMLGSGAYMLTPDQIDKAYTCTTNNVTGIFEKFSGTNVTAYWTIDGVQKQSVCTKGKWIPTRQWLELNKLSEKDITLGDVNESKITENNIEIVSLTTKTITVSDSKQVSINGAVYNITYIPKITTQQTIKCICEKTAGCQIKECLQ